MITKTIAAILITLLTSTSFAKINAAPKISSGLLDAAFEKNSVIAFGSSGHRNVRMFKETIAFLEKYGSDERFDRVFVEASFNLADFYARISVQELAEQEMIKLLPSNVPPWVVCSPTWAFIIGEIAPVIRQLNTERKTPIILVPIDSIDASKDPSLPNLHPGQGVQGSCRGNARDAISFVMSHDREKVTAVKYREAVSRRSKESKALVLYHSYHLARGLETCKFESILLRWTSNWNQISWLGLLEDEIKKGVYTILFDEKDEQQAPEGIFQYPSTVGTQSEFFSESQSFPGELKLQPSILTNLFGYEYRLTSTTKELFSAVWWSPSQEPLPRPSEPLPMMCFGF